MTEYLPFTDQQPGMYAEDDTNLQPGRAWPFLVSPEPTMNHSSGVAYTAVSPVSSNPEPSDPKPAINTTYTELGNMSQSTLRKTRTETNRSISEWVWEILATLITVACHIGIVAILALTEDKPLVQWTFFFSINTVVSTLISVAKSTMLFSVAACLGQLKWLYFKKRQRPLHHFGVFDEAARGPWGAFTVLRGGVHWSSMAYLGALIVLLALPLGPFVQQVVSFPMREVVTDDNAVSFGYTHNYAFGAKGDPIMGNSQGGKSFDYYPWISDETADSAMRGAMTTALYNITTPPLYNCSSRCIWKDTYVTLGFETTCSNVTVPTIATEQCWQDVRNAGPGGVTTCNMTTPGNITMEHSTSIMGGSTSLVVGTRRLDYGSLRIRSDVADNVGVSPTFLRVAVLGGLSKYYHEQPVYRNVQECEFSVVAYRLSNVSATGNNFSIGTAPEKISLGNGTYVRSQDTDTEHNNRDQIRFSVTNLPDMFVRATDFAALADYLSREPFTGEIGSMLSRSNPGIRSGLLNREPKDVFQEMAKSMTEYIRSGPGSSLAYGSRVDEVVFVQIQWAWLGLPLFAVLANVVLLAATILASRRAADLPLWKDKTLPLLFTEYDVGVGGLRTEMAGPEEVREYSSTAGAIVL